MTRREIEQQLAELRMYEAVILESIKNLSESGVSGGLALIGGMAMENLGNVRNEIIRLEGLLRNWSDQPSPQSVPQPLPVIYVDTQPAKTGGGKRVLIILLVIIIIAALILWV